MIAATESTRAYGSVNQQIWSQSEVIDAVRWNTANDELVCPICRARNGELAVVGAWEFPAHVNCRCWPTPVVLRAGQTLKHLPGRHDQLTHGRWASGLSGKPRNFILAGGQEATKWRDDWYDKIKGDLTPEERDALAEYKWGASEAVNDYYRHGTIPGDLNLSEEDAELIMHHLDLALEKSVVPEDVQVYRGWLAPKSLLDLGPDMVGHQMQDLGFSSTSLQPAIATNFLSGRSGTMMVINVPKGTAGMWMEFPLAETTLQNEWEVLLNRGLKFQITDYLPRKEQGEYHIITVEVVP